MVREASIYALKRLSSEERAAYGLRVLIMQHWPRGISKSDIDVWIPSAAPDLSLLEAYRTGRVNWHDFAVIYRVSQVLALNTRVVLYRDHLNKPLMTIYPQRPIDYLRQLKQEHGVITLLCWEADAPCHRFLLQELVDDPAIEAQIREAVYATAQSSSDTKGACCHGL